MVNKLKNLYRDLKSNVQEKSKALADAEKADKAKQTFFQNISHELRTPLHGILSFARLGKQMAPNENREKFIKYFSRINTSGERLMQMIDSILDLAKFESGHMTFNLYRSNVALILKKVEEELKATFLEKNITLKTIGLDIDYPALVDSEMICRVFRNLLGNALKLAPEKSTIKVEFTKNNQYIIISISDQGAGIPEDDTERIFEKFIQVGEGKDKGGTGLGLPICKEIIVAHQRKYQSRKQ